VAWAAAPNPLRAGARCNRRSRLVRDLSQPGAATARLNALGVERPSAPDRAIAAADHFYQTEGDSPHHRFTTVPTDRGVETENIHVKRESTEGDADVDNCRRWNAPRREAVSAMGQDQAGYPTSDCAVPRA
jgi:hypothetical protein